jgi:hypothetical protein
MADQQHLARVAKLRAMAARYKQLASCTTDETSIEILERWSRENEEEARRLEHEDLDHEDTVDHAA